MSLIIDEINHILQRNMNVGVRINFQRVGSITLVDEPNEKGSYRKEQHALAGEDEPEIIPSETDHDKLVTKFNALGFKQIEYDDKEDMPDISDYKKASFVVDKNDDTIYLNKEALLKIREMGIKFPALKLIDDNSATAADFAASNLRWNMYRDKIHLTYKNKSTDFSIKKAKVLTVSAPSGMVLDEDLETLGLMHIEDNKDDKLTSGLYYLKFNGTDHNYHLGRSSIIKLSQAGIDFDKVRDSVFNGKSRMIALLSKSANSISHDDSWTSQLLGRIIRDTENGGLGID